MESKIFELQAEATLKVILVISAFIVNTFIVLLKTV